MLTRHREETFDVVVSRCPIAAQPVDAHAPYESETCRDGILVCALTVGIALDSSSLVRVSLEPERTRNQHFGASAWMDVWTEADDAGGFRYQVVAEGGSAYIRRRVFIAALDGEQKLWRDGEPKRSRFDHTNYSFKDDGAIEGELASLAITPKRKDMLLVDGWLFVKKEDGDLVRIEGRLSKNPSFWTRRVEIVRRYGRVGGARVPTDIESVAQVLIAGQSTFRMTYDYETVNGVRVGNPQPRPKPEREN